MNTYIKLAVLLEHAALALREADAALSKLHDVADTRKFRDLPGFASLTIRARKALVSSWDDKVLLTVGDLCSQSEGDLLNRRNFGLHSLNSVREFMRQNGLSLNGE